MQHSSQKVDSGIDVWSEYISCSRETANDMRTDDTLGLLLAGGSGSRLHPMTLGLNKHLLPIFDKPLIYYPLSTLMLAGSRRIRLVTTPDSTQLYQRLLGDGSRFGVEITYVTQSRADGIVGALATGLAGQTCSKMVVMLGDNVLYGVGLGRHLAEQSPADGGHIFAVWLEDPSSYGVAYFDGGRLARLQEKPQSSSPGFAVPGLYFYGSAIADIIDEVAPSERGEREISSLNQALLDSGRLTISELPRGSIWLDAGSPDRLLDASMTISILQRRQGLLIGSPEEVAFRKGWIDGNQLTMAAKAYATGSFARTHLEKLAFGG